MTSTEKLPPIPPPPGVINALKAGLDVITARVSIILLPLALDAFLWLGPRLSVKNLFTALYEQMLTLYKANGLPVDLLVQVKPDWMEATQRFNVLSLLRTFPVGVASLMQGKMPLTSPLGGPAIVEVGSWPSLLGWMVLLTFLGWTLGAVFFRSVSRLILPSQAVRPSGRVLLHSLLFSFAFFCVVAVISLPVIVVLSLLNLLGAAVMQTGLFVLMLFASWLVVPLFFAPHGIFMQGDHALGSLVTSLRMSRFVLPSASMFVLALFLASQGLNILWAVPPDDSWMLLVGIAGHAFVTTALLAASFIYYRDMNAWLAILSERLKNSAPRQAL
jgi:hypothetical protein